jgi:hypothetical protein
VFHLRVCGAERHADVAHFARGTRAPGYAVSPYTRRARRQRRKDRRGRTYRARYGEIRLLQVRVYRDFWENVYPGTKHPQQQKVIKWRTKPRQTR